MWIKEANLKCYIIPRTAFHLIFERSNEKSHFSKTKIYFRKKTTPQLLEHIGQQNIKVGEKTNFGRIATIFQICSMDVDILS